jgi:squalene-hopene cyclase-like protein
METLRLDRLLEFLTGTQFVVGVLWMGLFSLSVALLMLSRTRWGRSNPLRKCLVLSVFAHLLLAGYATTVQIVASAPGRKEETIRVSIADGESLREETPRLTAPEQKPWEVYDNLPAAEPKPVELDRADLVAMRQPERRSRSKQTGLSALPLEDLQLAESARPDPESLASDDPLSRPSQGKAAEPIDAPVAKRRQPHSSMVSVEDSASLRRHDSDNSKAPLRASQGSIPSLLLEKPLPVPRLAHVPSTPDPKTALAGKLDTLTGTSPGRPAALTGIQSPHAANNRDPSTLITGSPVPPATDHLRPPALAIRDSGSPVSLAGLPKDASMTAGRPAPVVNRRDLSDHQVPRLYRLRSAPDRSRLARRNGASPETEAAVKAALKWLAENQEADGRWRAGTHGAGKEQLVAGRDRGGAGASADTGISGLALLAFLASGHTHQSGSYSDNVDRGVKFLLAIQAEDGNLGGEAQTYAFMYCHAMATFAITEAYGMTGDQELADAALKATGYILACQSPSTGGWRYKPGDDGDTSLLGWQVMALKSAELAGIPIPPRTQQGALRFLDSASSGPRRGLVAYRPTELPSRPMTAEALACRLFLGMAPYDSSARESGDYLLGELPGSTRTNLYYWYYGTLGMYQLQGSHWRQWNQALRTTLLASQQRQGNLAGSWSPDTVWGGYGGRVYSTALATLCLEVYYRFLPMHVEAALREGAPVYR